VESHAGLVEGDQAAVQDRDPVRVARQIGEHRFGAGEWRLGIASPGPFCAANLARKAELAAQHDHALQLERRSPLEGYN
jgi:hypothetical protein